MLKDTPHRGSSRRSKKEKKSVVLWSRLCLLYSTAVAMGKAFAGNHQPALAQQE